MQRILMIGSSKQAYNIANIFLSFPNVKIVAIVADDLTESFLHLVRMNDIATATTVEPFLNEAIDLIIDTTDHGQSQNNIAQKFSPTPPILTKSLVDLLLPYLREQYFENDNLRLILNTIRDGLIVVDSQGFIRLMNDRAFQIIERDHRIIGKHVKDIIPHSRLPNVLQSQKKEI